MNCRHEQRCTFKKIFWRALLPEPKLKLFEFMTKLSFPFTAEKIRALKAGDEVLISSVGFTGRSAQGLPAVARD
jgi:hypothetical protein